MIHSLRVLFEEVLFEEDSGNEYAYHFGYLNSPTTIFTIDFAEKKKTQPNNKDSKNKAYDIAHEP